MHASTTSPEPSGFHAHVYFRSESERARALALRAVIGRRFRDVTLGRVHDRPIGPHPIPMYQVAFSPDDFAAFVPFLMLERKGLAVLVHPLTGDPLAEHTEQACWLGSPIPLRLEVFEALAGKAAPAEGGEGK
ncbi:MAG: DOPA 4,5-dioxygenase family protein [bacterium]|nr:DOPA 4,5-dioxygenase family protein [bacterium]